MKLLNYRLLRVNSDVLSHRSIINGFYCANRSFHVPIPSQFFKKFQNPTASQASTKDVQISQHFRYHYEVNELSERLNSKYSPSSEFRSDSFKDVLDAHKDNTQHVINYLILAAKFGHNVKEMVDLATQQSYFDPFLNRLNGTIDEMSADEVVSSLIAFNLSNLPMHHPINRRLSIQSGHLLSEQSQFPLRSLSNLAIFSRLNDDQIYPYFFCADGTSHIIEHLEKCDNIRDLFYITAYFDSLHGILTKKIMTLHKAKMKEFLDEIDVKTHRKELFAILKFYENNMSFKNSRIIRNILLLLGTEISNISNIELQYIASTRDMINEPASLIPKIIKEAESRPDKSTDLNLIYCRLSKFMPDNLDAVSNELLAIVEQLDSKDIIKNGKLFTILRNKRYITKKEVYYKYWQKNFDDLTNLDVHAMDIDMTLSTLSHRYCHLQRGMTSRYRHHRFESLLREFILTEVKYGVSGCKPNRLAKLAIFIIGYAHDPTNDHIILPEYFVRKIEEMATQFTVNSVIDISAGIEAFRQHGIARTTNRRFAAQVIDRIGRLENLVDRCIERMLDERGSIQIDAILLLTRAYANQKISKHTRILEKLIKRLEEICASEDVIVTARTVQYATGSLNRIQIVVPNLCDHMLRFVNENMDIVGADTVTYLLFHLFSMGYEPDKEYQQALLSDRNKSESLHETKTIDFDNCIRIINRDFELIPAGLIVQACLALSFYQVLTLDLINRIFNIDFVTRLEHELAQMYDAKNYPKNILNLIMNLNRSVCLNYPEANVPWFQQNFIESQLVADPPKPGPYINDVYRMLLNYVGGDRDMIRVNHVTPYGYRIPFVVYFNSHKQLVMPPIGEGPQTLNKVAIIPLYNHSFRLNDTKMRGFNRLQERHLNILGYDVIQICYREWNSIHMDLPGAREGFLRNFLNKYDSSIS